MKKKKKEPEILDTITEFRFGAEPTQVDLGSVL